MHGFGSTASTINAKRIVFGIHGGLKIVADDADPRRLVLGKSYSQLCGMVRPRYVAVLDVACGFIIGEATSATDQSSY
ncbi:hypothetical protein ABIA06_005416 [Bradyrhizobium yuanmingense]